MCARHVAAKARIEGGQIVDDGTDIEGGVANRVENAESAAEVGDAGDVGQRSSQRSASS